MPNPTLRTDSLGLLSLLGATAIAAAIPFGPRLLASAPSPQQQTALLAEHRKLASDLERDLDATKRRVAILTDQARAVVQLVPAERVNERLVEMNAVVAQAGGSITQLNSLPAVTEGKSVTVPIKLAGTARYPDISLLVHALHDRFRDTAITSLKVSAAPSPDAGPAAFAIDLGWHAAPVNPAANAAPAASADAASKSP